MATVDIKNAVKAGMLEAFAEQEAVKAHQSLVDFHEANTSEPKSDPMATVIENQYSIIELFKNFNDRTSGIGNAATAQESYGQSGLAQQAMASSQNSMSLGNNFTGDMVAGNGSIRNIIVNHGIVFTDSSGGIVQGGVSNVGAAQTVSPLVGNATESNDNISYKAGIVGDETDRVQSKIDHEERKAYQEYTMKPTMTKLSQALDKYLKQENQPLTVGDSGFGLPGFLGSLIGGAIGTIGGLAVGWMSGLKTQWSKIGQSFVGAWKKSTAWLKDSKLGKSVSNLGTKFKNGINGMKDAIVGQFKSMTASVREAIGSMKSSFMKTLKGWKDSIKNSAVGKVAGAVKSKIGGFLDNAKGLFDPAKNAAKEGNLMSKLGSKLQNFAKPVTSAVSKFTGPAVNAAKGAFNVASKIGAKIPWVQAGIGIADTVKNVYDVAKKGGNIKDIMSTGLAGVTDATLNMLMVPEIVGTVKGAIKGAAKNGFKGALSGITDGFMNAHDPNNVSYGQAFAAGVAKISGNETDTTKALYRANMYGLTKDQVGLANINGNAGGFGTATALYQGDKKLATGSMVNTNNPNANTGDEVSGKRISESDKNKETIEAMKEAFIEALTSEEVKTANAEQAKTTGEAINSSLMG